MLQRALSVEFIIFRHVTYSNVLGFLRHALFIILLVIIVDCGQVLFSLDVGAYLWQAHTDVDFFDARLAGIDRLFGVGDVGCLCDVAYHFHSVGRLAAVLLAARSLRLQGLRAGNRLEVDVLPGAIGGIGQAQLEDILGQLNSAEQL